MIHWRPNTEQSTVTNDFYMFCCFCPLNLESSEILVLTLCSNVMMHVSVIWFELDVEKKEENSGECNVCKTQFVYSYFFYKNNVYQYLFAYTDTA